MRSAPTSRRWRSAFRALRAILGCVLVTTCSTDSLAPRPPVRGDLDLTSLVRMRDFPITVDQILVELRRSDESIAFSRTLTAADWSSTTSGYRIPIEVELKESPETLLLHAEVRAGGVLYYEVNASVTAVLGASVTTEPLTPTYVGPGIGADSIALVIDPAVIGVGGTATATATVYQNNVLVPGVPVEITATNAAIGATATGLNTALINGGAAAEGSYTISARTPTELTTTASLTIATTGSNVDRIVRVSSDSQVVTVNQAVESRPTVRVEDANGNPLENVTVTYTVLAGNGSVTGGSAVSNAQGEATVGSWRVGQVAGVNTLQAAVAGVTPVSFTATGTAGVPVTIAKISGDTQTDSAGRVLPLPLVAEVRDSFANPVPSTAFSWAVTDGTIAPPTGTTNAQGRVSGNWTLGLAQGSPTATLTAGQAQTIFSATVLFGSPTISLSWAGIPGVGIGLTSTVNVTLNSAPAATLAIALESSNTGFFTVAAPDTVYIGAGQTTGSKVINGISAGTATLTASAPGYSNGTLTVAVQNRNISLPPTLNVPYGQTASLPIQLPAPAPAGGVTFTVVSDDPTRVGVATPTVTISAGAQTANATLDGVLPGPATVTVSNPAYVTGTSATNTTASLVFIESSVNINTSFGGSATIQFRSNNTVQAAPSPGITVTLTPINSACLAAVSPRTIPTGQSSVTTTLTYGGSATTPCNTGLIATAPNLVPDTIPVTVSAAPGISMFLNSGGPIGQGLQEPASFNLAASNHGGTTVTLTSSDSSALVLSTSTTVRGGGTLVIPILPGNTSASYHIQSIAATNTAVTITATASGFSNGVLNATVVTPGVELGGVPTTTTTLAPNTIFYAQVGVPNGQATALQRVQNVTPGLAAPVRATFTSQFPSIGLVVDSLNTPTGAATGQATIPVALYYTSTSGVTSGSVAFRPVSAGTDTITVSLPGFTSMTTNGVRQVVVTQPTISLSPFSTTVGSGLQETGSGNLNNGAQHGGATVTLTSSNPSIMLLSTRDDSAGAASIQISLPNGQTSFTYYMQMLDGATGPVMLTATEPRFVSDSVSITAVTPGIEAHGIPANVFLLSPPFAFYAQVGVPNGQGTALQRVQNRRAAAPPLVATFTTSDTLIVRLADSSNAATGGISATARIEPRFYYTPTGSLASGGVEARLVGGGSDTIRVSMPGFTPMASATRVANVNQPNLSVSSFSSQVGAGLIDQGSVSLSAASHGGAAVTLTSRNPASLLVDTLPNGPGYASLVKSLPNGSTSFSYYLIAPEGQTGTSRIVVTEPRFTADSVQVSSVVPGVEFHGLPANLTTLSPDVSIYAQVGVLNGQGTALQRVQNRRSGGAPLVATFTSTPASVAGIIDSLSTPNHAATGTARIPAGTYYTPTNGPASGGINVHPILNGTATISVAIPGYTTASSFGVRSLSISQPGITTSMSHPRVGSGLQEAASVTLEASNHGGVTVTLTSSDPAIALVARNNTTTGAASIQVAVPAGQTTFTYYVQAPEGVTGTPTITASAPGFTNGTTGPQVVTPAIDLQNVPLTWRLIDGDFLVYSQTGVPNGQGTALERAQYIRPGGVPLTVTFTSTNATVGVLRNQAGDAASRTAVIPADGSNYYTPLSLAQGGVYFHPLTLGASSITTSAPGFTVVGSPRPVTVQ